MAHRLICPAGHEWNLRPAADGLENSRPPWLCPVCGDLPALGSTVGWEIRWWAWVLLIGLFAGIPALFAAVLVALRAGQEVVHTWGQGFVFVYVGALCLLGVVWGRRGARELERVYAELGFTSSDAPTEDRVYALRAFPLIRKLLAFRVAGWAAGACQGAAVVIADLKARVRWVKGWLTFTVVLFTEPVLGLPDFEIEPVADRGKFWNMDLLQLVGLRRRDPLQGEPFGDRYRLATAQPEAVDTWLSPEARGQLARHPGWVIQASGGRLLIARPYRQCPARGRPVLLALAWRVRELFARQPKSAGAEVGA